MFVFYNYFYYKKLIRATSPAHFSRRGHTCTKMAARSVAYYKRTLDHLRSWSFKLPSHLRVASIKFDETERTHDGLR